MSQRMKLPFQCPFCGGEVDLRSAVGMTWSVVAGQERQVPPEVEVPRCGGCGESFLQPQDSQLLSDSIRGLT